MTKQQIEANILKEKVGWLTTTLSSFGESVQNLVQRLEKVEGVQEECRDELKEKRTLIEGVKNVPLSDASDVQGEDKNLETIETQTLLDKEELKKLNICWQGEGQP